jgi:hypothetical protein
LATGQGALSGRSLALRLAGESEKMFVEALATLDSVEREAFILEIAAEPAGKWPSPLAFLDPCYLPPAPVHTRLVGRKITPR